MKSSSGILLALAGAVLLMFGLSGKYRSILSAAFPGLVGASAGASSGNQFAPGDAVNTNPAGSVQASPPVRGGDANNPSSYLCPDGHGNYTPCAGAGNNGIPGTGVFIPGIGGGGSFTP